MTGPELEGRRHVAGLLADTLDACYWPASSRPPDPAQWDAIVTAAAALSRAREDLHPGYRAWQPRPGYRPSARTVQMVRAIQQANERGTDIDPFAGLPGVD